MGEAVITDSGHLLQDGVKKVIHTVGPVFWRHSPAEAAALLTSCYRNSLRLAREHGLLRVAFPAISCGAYGFPLALAATEAVAAIAGACQGFQSVSVILFEKEAVAVWESAARALQHPASLSASAPLPVPLHSSVGSGQRSPQPALPAWHSAIGPGPGAAAQQPAAPPHSPPLLGVPIDSTWDSDEGDGLVHIGGGLSSAINFNVWQEDEEEVSMPSL